LPSNDALVFHLTNSLHLHYLWKAFKYTKYANKSATSSVVTWKKIIRF